MKKQIEIADCLGNNCAVICPECQKAFCVSGFLNTKKSRKCPNCENFEISYLDAKKIWDAADHGTKIEQDASRLIFKKEWLGYDVWVTFSEDGVTYRYPHDQLLQIFISRLGIIENTVSWTENGLYHFPRLSQAQKKILERYIVG
jgi:hypothetical protein